MQKRAAYQAQHQQRNLGQQGGRSAAQDNKITHKTKGDMGLHWPFHKGKY
jgi:hypothetical protein